MTGEPKHDVSAIVLAAGESKRMGANKMLLPYQSSTIIASTVTTIQGLPLKEVIVVTGRDAALVEDSLKHLDLSIVHNPGFVEGMTSSIKTGLKHASGKGYMICLGDMPLVSQAEYLQLLQAFSAAAENAEPPIVVPMHASVKGNPVIFHARYLPLLLSHADPEGCKQIVQAHRSAWVEVAMDSDSVLRDIDSPEDYDQLSDR
jgi:molybdenum cofactor cytidylyltransferase